LEKITIIDIATAANIKIRTMTATAPIPIFLHIINHVVLYVIRKAIDHKTTPKKNEKSLKLSLGLPTEINLVNLMTDLINDSINIL
jgi:hypothetical protein